MVMENKIILIFLKRVTENNLSWELSKVPETLLLK